MNNEQLFKSCFLGCFRVVYKVVSKGVREAGHQQGRAAHGGGVYPGLPPGPGDSTVAGKLPVQHFMNYSQHPILTVLI